MTILVLSLLCGLIGGAAGWVLRARRDSKVIRDLRRENSWLRDGKPKRRNVSRDALENQDRTRVSRGRMRRRKMHFRDRSL